MSDRKFHNMRTGDEVNLRVRKGAGRRITLVITVPDGVDVEVIPSPPIDRERENADTARLED